MQIDSKNGSEKIVDAYPARVSFRGFSEESTDRGFKRLSKYMVDNAEQLKKEAFEEDETHKE